MSLASRSNVIVRKAGKDDVGILGRFGAHLMSLHHEWDAERFIAAGNETPTAYSKWLDSQLQQNDVVILTAEEDGIAVGYTYAGLEGYDYMALRGPAGVIHDIYVDPDRRRAGIGRTLLEATINKLQELGARQVVLSTAYTNAIAQRLFQATGFRPTMIEMTRTLSIKPV